MAINPYSGMFKAVSSIVTGFEHKESSEDNISNWKTQVYSNESFEHAVSIVGEFAGYALEITTPDSFLPTTLKGNANTYHDMATLGEFYKQVDNKDKKADSHGSKTHSEEFNEDDYLNASITLFAYLVGWLFIGKPLASVNMARGRMILSMIETLKIKDIKVIIHGVSMGGSKPKQDILINQEEIAKYSEFQDVRAKYHLDVLKESGNHSVQHVNPVVSTTFKKSSIKKI